LHQVSAIHCRFNDPYLSLTRALTRRPHFQASTTQGILLSNYFTIESPTPQTGSGVPMSSNQRMFTVDDADFTQNTSDMTWSRKDKERENILSH